MHIREIVPRITNTWIFIGFNDQLKNGSKKFIKVMHRDLVLWRTNSGTISLFDAYCPHMGANLSYGKVRGEVLECNYHKKCYRTTGVCVSKGNAAHSYPLHVSHNMIFAWFGSQEPSWEMPDLLTGFHKKPESKWKIFKIARLRFNFHPRNMGENSVDALHFKTFHNACNTYEPAEILEITDHSLTTRINLLDNPLFKSTKKVELVITSLGPSIVIVNTSIKLKKRNEYFKFIYFGTPTQDETTNFVVVMAIPDETKFGISLWEKINRYLFARVAFIAQVWEFRRESKSVFMHKSNFRPSFSPTEEVMRIYYDWYSRFYLSET